MIYLPTAFFDPPLALDTGVTLIPRSSSLPLQVIADSGQRSSTAFAFSDSTGAAIGVFIGEAGSETIACIIGNGVTSIASGRFPPHSRVSLRALQNTDITSGILTGNLVLAL